MEEYNPKAVGERSEAMVLARFLELGWIVLTPFGDNQRYDLVIDRGFGFETVQVKTARLLKGAVSFATCSSYHHRGRGRRDYRGQCDLFAAFCPTLGTVYLVPVAEVGKSACNLRIEAARNSQTKGVRIAADYQI